MKTVILCMIDFIEIFCVLLVRRVVVTSTGMLMMKKDIHFTAFSVIF